jgi:hypothetical protein
MQTKLTWKKGVFSNSYRIFRDDVQIGKLQDKVLSQTIPGDLEDSAFLFRTKGFFRQHTEIIDSRENKIIGEITYNTWKTKATISINQKTLNWQYNNVWNTKWSLSAEEGIIINYAGSSTKGTIDSRTEDPLLILSGLFVTNYYWQASLAIFVAVLIPVWLTVF